MRILLVEDDQKLASFICAGLEESGHKVFHVSDGRSGLVSAQGGQFDVAIFDIMLPQRDGLSVLEQLRSEQSNLPVLILSARKEVSDRVKGLAAGGDDYLTKPFAQAELLARLEALVRRAHNQVNRESKLVFADLVLDKTTHRVFRGDTEIELQPREFDLLRFLLENTDRVIPKTMIISQVWNYNFDPQTNIVEACICRLREKIDLKGLQRLIHTVRGVGYVLRGES
jgi:two-component system, OmpR family, response regulator